MVKRIQIGKYRWRFGLSESVGMWEHTRHMKKSKRPMGRFGGGWNWKLGIAISKSTIIVDLLYTTIRIDKVRDHE